MFHVKHLVRRSTAVGQSRGSRLPDSSTGDVVDRSTRPPRQNSMNGYRRVFTINLGPDPAWRVHPAAERIHAYSWLPRHDAAIDDNVSRETHPPVDQPERCLDAVARQRATDAHPQILRSASMTASRAQLDTQSPR